MTITTGTRRTSGPPATSYTVGAATGALPLAGHALQLWRRPLEMVPEPRTAEVQVQAGLA